MAQNSENPLRKIGAAVVMLIIAFLVMGMFDYIPAGTVGVVSDLGNIRDTPLEPGVHYTGLFASTINMDTRIQKVQYDASAASKDLQVVHTKIAVNFHIRPSRAPTIFKNIGEGYEDVIIQPILQEAVKSQTAKYNAEELITQREHIKDDVTQYLTGKLAEQGIDVTEVSITNFDFSTAFNEAIEQKQVAAQNVLKAENNLKATEYDAKALEIQSKLIEIKKLDLSRAFIDKWDGHMPMYITQGSGMLTMLPIEGMTQAPVERDARFDDRVK